MTKEFIEEIKYTLYEPHELTDDIVEDATIFVFDDYSVENDEFSWVVDGNIRLSSHHKGIVSYDFDKKQYVRSYYGSQTEIGNLKHVLIREEK